MERLNSARPFRFAFAFKAFGLLLLLASCGCGNGQFKTFPISGSVAFEDGDGYPKFGDIEFYNEANKINARGKLNRDGTFTVGTYEDADGAVEGTHQVIIIQRTRNHLTAQLEQEITHNHGDLIDLKYYDYRGSDLVAKVEASETNNIKLLVKRLPDKKQEERD